MNNSVKCNAWIIQLLHYCNPMCGFLSINTFDLHSFILISVDHEHCMGYVLIGCCSETMVIWRILFIASQALSLWQMEWWAKPRASGRHTRIYIRTPSLWAPADWGKFHSLLTFTWKRNNYGLLQCSFKIGQRVGAAHTRSRWVDSIVGSAEL